ncbi:MAG TPA: hypothetical protein VIH95_11160 [Acidimicrobiales bacterium]
MSRHADAGYWPGPWSGEDGGPRRLGVPADDSPVPSIHPGTTVDVVSRTDPLVTMVVTRDPGEVFLLRTGMGPDVTSTVERIDSDTLEARASSGPLAGGPMWPGGLAAHANGSLYVVFGNHAHRLSADLEVLATVELPRARPYNSFVILPDGTLVTKDFAGSLPGAPVAAAERVPCELVALEPDGLGVVDRIELTEPSIARLSSDGDHVYVVGDTSLLRVGWDGGFRADPGFSAAYRTREGQTYGWDCVLALGAAWFLDDGDGSTNFDGSFRGKGVSTAPLQVIRVDLSTREVTAAEICGVTGGLVTNPPIVDVDRRIVVGYDSGNGVMAAFDIGPDGELSRRWRRDQDHAAHMLLLPGEGALVTGDYNASRMIEQVVVVDITTGTELARVDTEGPLQSAVFPALGWDATLYWCSLSTVSRLRFT